MDGMLLCYLDTKKDVKFNLPRYIVHAMISIAGRYNDARTPGFGMMITRICRKKSINLNAADGRISNFPMWTLGWKFLMKKGFFGLMGDL